MSDTKNDLRSRRQELLRQARVPPTKAFTDALKAADPYDLEWLLGRLDEQLEETPHHVQATKELERILAEIRHKRMVVASELHHKSTIENVADKRSAIRRANLSLLLSTVAVIVSLVVAIAGFL